MNHNILLLLDWKHRTWNDVQRALEDSGLWQYIKLTEIILNADVGPWSNHTWWGTLVGALPHYIRCATPDCKFSNDLLPWLMKDRDLTGGDLMTAQDRQELFEPLPVILS